MGNCQLSVEFWIGTVIMNKFVLGIFVILAIGMADLPSTFGCNPDLVRPTTPSPVTRKPKTGHGKPNPKGGKPNPKGSEPNTRSVEARSNVFELEMEGFSICNTDGIEGLTFNEINACRIRLGNLVLYPWPTASDFDAADDNKDGNLTKAEFVQYIS